MSARLDNKGTLDGQYHLELCTPLADCCTLYILYILLDLGIAQTAIQRLKDWIIRCDLRNMTPPEPLIVLLSAMKKPPSLLQLARLAVRKCMRDVHVLEDCYELPVPSHMQDYLSFRSLNAEIRRWFIKEEKPSPIDYAKYNAKYEVLTRYGIKDMVGPVKMEHELCTHVINGK